MTLWRVRLFLTSRVGDPIQDTRLWESASGQAVALAMLWRRRSNSDYLVLEVFPHPDFTTQELLAELQSWGAETAMLVTISTNASAVGLYQKTGFIPYKGMDPAVYYKEL
jgi:hypothetical protein